MQFVFTLRVKSHYHTGLFSKIVRSRRAYCEGLSCRPLLVTAVVDCVSVIVKKAYKIYKQSRVCLLNACI